MEADKVDKEPHHPTEQKPGSGVTPSQAKAEESKGGSSQAPAGANLKEEHRQPEPKQVNKDHAQEEKKSHPAGLHVSTTKEAQMDESMNDERADFDHEEANQNWKEYRIIGKAPRRRAYHASFIYNDYFYIHGGHDIREGSLEKMYKINLFPKGNENSWEEIHQRGIEKPGKIGFHTITRHDNKAYLIGGSYLGMENENMYVLDIDTSEWRILKPIGEAPEPRDEHCAKLWNDSIVIFGGNVNGYKTNEVWIYSITDNKWSKLEAGNSPCARSNNGATLSGNSLYIFGGKDADNNKLNDLWVLDITSKQWKQLDQKGDTPIERSGCSLVAYKNYLVLFGGIFELTKELGDCYIYDLGAQTWYVLFEEIDSPTHKHSPNSTFGLAKFGRQNSINSPSPVNRGNSSFNVQNPNDFSMKLSKTKLRKKNQPLNIFEVDSSMIKKKKLELALKKKKDTEKNPLEDSMLTSPTSLSMKNSFLIKNSVSSNSHGHYNSMKRRKLGQSNSPGISPSPAKGKRTSYVAGIRPRPRDGHTAEVTDDLMIIFGGDRHQMPFNDLFSLNLARELNK